MINIEEEKKNAWFFTYTGRRFYPWNPREEDISIMDIAHALANTCRYGGQCRFYYSVAVHSLMVAEQVTSESHKLAALMHDAAEAYVGDMPKPFKPFMIGFSEAEDLIMQVIANKFGFQYPLDSSIHAVDHKMLHTEAKLLLPGSPWLDSSQAYNNIQKLPKVNPEEAEEAFLQAFAKLYSIT